jgi:hypothetical protein
MENPSDKTNTYYPISPIITKQELVLINAKINYCKDLYAMEMTRKETLERKTQFYLSIVSLFLSAIILKIDFFTSLQSTISNNTNDLIGVVFKAISVILILSTLSSLIAILQAIRLQTYRTPSFMPLTDQLFKPDSIYKDELTFLRDVAAMYAMAVEYNYEQNFNKAKCIKVASISVLTLVCSVTVLMGGSAYSLFIA